MRKSNGTASAVIGGVFFTVLTSGAQAQSAGAPAATGAQSGELEEVIVTAERRTADVQKTSVSISVRTGQDLLNQGKYSLAQILEDVPGVEATGGGVGAQAGNGITIRGVQSNSGAGGSEIVASASTAVYVDDIYEGLGGNYDLARVEVLRGPQGTLYGRSATSGVVSTHTRDPELGNWNGFASIEAGNYDLRHYTGAINAPLGDVWALRVSGNRYERDGYISAVGGATESNAGRAKLLFNPNEAFSLMLGVAIENVDANSGGSSVRLTSPDSTYLYNYNVAIGTGTTKFRQYWGKVDWDVGFGTLTYLPALRTIQRNTLTYATAALPIGVYTLTHPVDEPYNHYNTHELRLNSNAGSKTTWQAGVIYFDNKVDNNVTGYWFPSGSYAWNATTDRDSRDLGVFGEATYPITDTWRVTGGLRYDKTRVAVDQLYTTNSNVDVSTFPSSSKPGDTIHVTGEAGTRRYDNKTFKARVEHDLTPSNLVYATVSSGFVPGDVQAGIAGNTPTTLHTDVFSFGAETLTAYELGSKNRFLDNRLQVNADVFYYNYGGFQTGGISICQGACISFATILVPARMEGAELEVEYQLTPNDRVSLSYGYINARYVDMPVLYTNSTVWDRPAGIPPQKVNAAYEHVFHLPGDSSLSLRGDGRLLSPYEASGITGLLSKSAAAAGGGAYTRSDTEIVWNLSATWASSDNRYSVTAYGRNLTDNRYKTNVNVTATGGLAATATPYVPRTYGAVLSVNF